MCGKQMYKMQIQRTNQQVVQIHQKHIKVKTRNLLTNSTKTSDWLKLSSQENMIQENSEMNKICINLGV